MSKSLVAKRNRNATEAASVPLLKRSKFRSSSVQGDGSIDAIAHAQVCADIAVSSLFVKKEKGKSMKPVLEMRLKDQIGIEEDVGAKQLSPRQVLIVGSGDLEQNNLMAGELRENITISFSGGDSPGQPCSTTRSAEGAHFARSGKCGANMCNLVSSGDIVRIGKTCKLRVTMACEPCGHVIDYMKQERETKDGSAQVADLGSRVTFFLKSVVGQSALVKKEADKAQLPSVKTLGGYRGMLATCLRGGIIHQGDAVAIEKASYEALPGPAKERVIWLLSSKIPFGNVVTVRDLLAYIGEPIGYARALPAVIRSILKLSPGSQVPIHRLVDSDCRLMTRCIENQESRLRDEGITFEDSLPKKEALRVSGDFLWEPTHEDLYLKDRLPLGTKS